MPADIFRDAFFGHVCRLLTGGKVFQYPEEKDPSYWLRYINEDKSRHMAQHGRPRGGGGSDDNDAAEDEEKKEATVLKETADGGIIESSSSAAPDIELGPQGRVEKIVDWDGPDDPEVRKKNTIPPPPPKASKVEQSTHI